MKIKAKYQGAVIRDPRIGRALEVNEKNLQTLIAYGHEYVVEFEEPKQKPKKKSNKTKEDHEVKVRERRSKHDSSNTEGEADA